MALDASAVIKSFHDTMMTMVQEYKRELDASFAEAGPNQDQKRRLFNQLSQLPLPQLLEAKLRFEDQFGTAEWDRQLQLANQRQQRRTGA